MAPPSRPPWIAAWLDRGQRWREHLAERSAGEPHEATLVALPGRAAGTALLAVAPADSGPAGGAPTAPADSGVGRLRARRGLLRRSSRPVPRPSPAVGPRSAPATPLPLPAAVGISDAGAAGPRPGGFDEPALGHVGPPDVAGAPPVAAAFLAELGRHRVERPRPLPLRYEPVARAIVGDRRVHVSTGAASRRALARVGKRAATTGDTIHLARADTPVDVVAHELTHVAHPSPIPRFFADPHDSPEERRAEAVAAVMRRATATRPGATPRGGPADQATASARRRPAPGSGVGSAETTTASDLAARLDAGDTRTIRRAIGGHRRTTASPVLPTTTGGAPRPPTGTEHDTFAADSTPSVSPERAPAPTTTDVLTDFHRTLELLEERILTELERRGGRFRGGF